MATPMLCCGFECGIDTGLAAHWALTGATFQTAIVRSGKYALLSNPTTGLHFAQHTISSQTNVWRFYLYITAHPSAIAALSSVSDGVTSLGLIYDTVTSKYYAYAGATLATTGITLSLSTWYLVDIKALTNSTTWTCDVSIDSVAQIQASLPLQSATTMTTLNMGNRTVNSTHSFYCEDVWYSVTSADYPYGAGKVLSFIPSRDGPHNVVGHFLYGTAGRVIVDADRDTYRLIAKSPLPTVEVPLLLINQETVITGGYVDNYFEQTIEPNPPRAVEIIEAYHQAGTGVCDSTSKLLDNATADTVFAHTGAGQTALRYATKQYALAPSAVAWNLNASGDGAFNNLRHRFGHSSDATPDVYLDAAMIEAEFPDSNVEYLNPVFCCGMECAAPLGADGQHWSGVNTPTFETSVFRNGLRSGRCNPTAGSKYFMGPIEAVRLTVIREYIRITTLPNGDVGLLGYANTGSRLWGLVYKNSDGKFYAGSDAAGTITVGATGLVLTANDGVWHRIDLKIDTSANPHLIDGAIDGVALGQASVSAAAVDQGRRVLGNPFASPTYDIYFDDWISSYSPNDYPIGAGYVISLVPGSDGVHTGTGTNIAKGTIATPVGDAVTSADTDVFNWANARPILGGATDNTRLVNQVAVAALEYAEVKIEPSVEPTAPRAVEVLMADRQATTAAGSMEIRVVQKQTTPNGEVTIVNYQVVAGTTTDKYTTKQLGGLAPGGVPWTVPILKDLYGRFGFSGDATPDQYWRGMMIEAEFGYLPANPLIINQAVNRMAVR